MSLYLHFLPLLALAVLVSGAVPQRQPISPGLFKLFVRYTNFTSASVPQPCPRPPYGSTAVGYVNETSTDTQASVFRDDSRRELILSIPGTATPRDDLTDLTFLLTPFLTAGVSCADCFVHTGFLQAWNSIADQVGGILKRSLTKHKGYKVVITGHSLGAGIAQLAYASLKGQGLPVSAAYTMGQPRIGNAQYANYIDGLAGAKGNKAGDFYRITHAADPIPAIPPRIALYRHSKTEYWEAGKAVQNATTTYRCIGQEPADCSNAHQDFSQGDDHVLYSNIEIGEGASCGL